MDTGELDVILWEEKKTRGGNEMRLGDGKMAQGRNEKTQGEEDMGLGEESMTKS